MPLSAEDRQRDQVVESLGVGGRGLDDRRVGQDPSGRDVASLGDFVSYRPQFANGGQGALVAHLVDTGGASPAIPAGRRRGLASGPKVVEFLCGPSAFVLLGQHARDRFTQLDEHLDVESRIVEPRRRQRTPRPVRRAVAFGQPDTEQALRHRRQVDPVETGQPPCQLGVVQRRWPHADLGEARQILVGRVQNPLVLGQHVGDGPQHGLRVAAVAHRVDQHGARAGSPDLNQVGAVGVPESRGPLGVHRERAMAAGQ